MLTLEQNDDATLLLEPEAISRLIASFVVIFPWMNAKHYLVDLSFASKEQMQQLNLDTRQKDSATDVLSFPLQDGLAAITDNPLNEVLLGSIVICPDVATEQNTPLIELAAHGILHLLGFDHETDMATWSKEERAIIDEAARHELTLSGISKGYL